MKHFVALGMMVLFLGACQPATEEALPTLANIEAISTERAPTATATSLRRELPPTFTPTNTYTPSPTETSTPITPTPQGFRAGGTLYYIYNGDSIIAVDSEGTQSDLLFTFGVGRRIAQLTPSPDGQLLAFVGAANGTAQEVYVMSRDGTYLQQISCLNYLDVRDPQWVGDGQVLSWYAASSPTQAGAIYVANFVGSNDCPNGNAQRTVVNLETPVYSGFAWNRAGDTVYYSAGDDLLAYDVADDSTRTLAFTRTVGANTNPLHHPSADELVFMSLTRTTTGTTTTAQLASDTTRAAEPFTVSLGVVDGLQAMTFSRDGGVLIARYPDGLLLRNNRTGNLVELVKGLAGLPEAAVNPTNTQVAYTLTNAAGIMQLFIVDVNTRTSRQLTRHTEGTVSSPVWLAQTDGG